MTLSLLADRLYGSDSLVEIVDDSSLWEGEDITMATGWTTPSKTVQSELEIRYFINASVSSYCLEWVVILGVLLQDLSIFMHVQQQLNYLDSQITFPDDIDTRLLDGINSLSEWAAINWSLHTDVTIATFILHNVLPYTCTHFIMSYCMI